MELEKKLALYQVFLKLYEHKRELLDDILQLEDSGEQLLEGLTPKFVIGVVCERQIYLLTNLLNFKTQCLFQPQHTWTIGRGRNTALSVPDKLLSRYHAVIRYIDNQGFYLVDADSTNGTFVNQRRISEPVLLQDGDCLHLGSHVFNFFLAKTILHLEDVPPSVLAKLDDTKVKSKSPVVSTPPPLMQEEHSETFIFLKDQQEVEESSPADSVSSLPGNQNPEVN